MSGGPTQPRADQHRPGAVCWIDLGVPDVESAAAFYTGMFGWQINPPSPHDPAGYRIAYLDGHPVAALGPAEQPGPPYWTVYVHTPDAAATARSAVAAGGSLVVPAAPAGDAGIAAVIRDPTGAPLSLWQPGTHPGTWASGAPGTLAAVELRTSQHSRQRTFLQGLLGWQTRGNQAVLDGQPVASWTRPPPGAPRPLGSPWLVRFHVHEVPTALRRAADLGATTIDDETCNLIDPAGALVGLTATTTA